MEYVTVGQVMRINANVLMGYHRIRDPDMLEAAVMRPQASAFGQDAYPTIFEKAAALLHSLVMNHPFTDGNKRTATLATLLFLRMNGIEKKWIDENAYWFVMAVANGKRTVQQAAAWLRQHTVQSTAEK
jgi:death-on-curing protein